MCDSFSSSEDSDNSEPDHLQAEDFSFDFIKEIVKEAESKKNLRNHLTLLTMSSDDWTGIQNSKLRFGPKIRQIKYRTVLRVIPEEDL